MPQQVRKNVGIFHEITHDEAQWKIRYTKLTMPRLATQSRLHPGGTAPCGARS